MIKKLFPGFIAIFIVHASYAQMPGGAMGGGFKGAKAKVGHFYGKVVDSITGKAIPFAAIQISGPQWDSVSHTLKTVALQGLLTGDNGEFSFEKLPVMGQFTIQINAMGYHNYSKTVSFDLGQLMKNAKKAQNLNTDSPPDPNAMSSLINAVDKDLGNIKIGPDATQIKAVTVNGEAPPMELKLDKRVFDVSKSLTTTGGTAEDVLKTIPAVNVDIDGNVTLRNASPTIYVDGLPTTLTIDQIPSDEIDKIEVITNPSAKFDASAGTGGIINIIMKHNQAIGYNGSIRAGIDQYGKYNAGFDFNLRQGKINWFLNLHYHQVKRIMYGSETKDTVNGQLKTLPYLINSQKDTNTMDGYFAYVRTGFDYFIDNRNTITVSATYATGNFNVTDFLHTNTYTVTPGSPEGISYSDENSSTNRVFNNPGASVLYKHLFPKEDENITASVTANVGSSTGNSLSNFYNDNYTKDSIANSNQQQITSGMNYYYVGKVDYSDPITKKIRLDCGLMTTLNNVTSNNNIILNEETVNTESTDYIFNEQIYAAYFTFSHDLTSRLSYQVALRVEESLYSGTQTDTSTTSNLNKQDLLKPFPGAFITYHLTEKSDLQLSYTTHITRPSFNQLVVNNYSNPESIQFANPNLKPAYQNSFELNYMHTFDKRSSLLLSAYYKITYDIVTTRLDSESYNSTLGQEVYYNSYANANSAYSEGAEATAQFSPTNWLDVTANYNLYESGINATNLNIPDTTKPYLSYFAKLNFTFKLPKNFTIQLNGSYQSKTQVPVGGSGGGRWGGGGYGGVTPSSSGYIIPTYSLDAAIKKEFLKNNKASFTFNVRDVFATAVNGTDVTATNEAGYPLFYQTTLRRNLAPYFSLNFSYRFGQMDISIFKRKNNNIDSGPDMGTDTGN